MVSPILTCRCFKQVERTNGSRFSINAIRLTEVCFIKNKRKLTLKLSRQTSITKPSWRSCGVLRSLNVVQHLNVHNVYTKLTTIFLVWLMNQLYSLSLIAGYTINMLLLETEQYRNGGCWRNCRSRGWRSMSRSLFLRWCIHHSLHPKLKIKTLKWTICRLQYSIMLIITKYSYKFT